MSESQKSQSQKTPAQEPAVAPAGEPKPAKSKDVAKEIGGPKGLEPTRYGDWEKNGRCIDF